MKKLFDTPKKAVISTLCIAAVVLGAAIAVPVLILNNTLIGKNDAEKNALNDAGLDASQVSGMRSELDFEDGRFQYEVDFYYDGIEYEYLILARDGDIISRDTDGQQSFQASAKEESANKQAPGNDTGTEKTSPKVQSHETVSEPAAESAGEPASESIQNTVISLDEAKEAALADAGLTMDAVTFTKARLDRDDRRQVYDIEFYSADAEYDYEINADDGTVREYSVDAFRIHSDLTSADANAAEKYIGIDRAKELALAHAGLTDTEVRFSKAKLENDDRKTEYEIEFYCGTDEYECSIDAITGEVLEFSSEHH